jgi:SAM-dependent methyltransferase
VCGAPTLGRAYGDNPFRECVGCGYGILAAGGSAADYWAEATFSDHESAFWQTAKRAYFDSALDLLATLAPGRRLIDVGGGVGYFAERALARGWDAVTLDVSERVTAVASERIGRERARTVLAEEEPGSFDAATLWCVVAHTPEPAEVVAGAADALRPGGVLWLTTPNFTLQKRYAAARLRLGRPIDFARDDHVGHFTPAAVARLLRDGGFTSVRFHFRGVTERCIVAASNGRPLVAAKRGWNRIAHVAARSGLPNLMSELQVTAVRR